MTRLVITGLGVTAAMGADTDTLWNNLLRGADTVREIDEWQVDGARSRRGTLLRIDQLRKDLPQECEDAPDTAVSGVFALAEVLHAARLDDIEARRHVGLVIGTTSGGEMDAFMDQRPVPHESAVRHANAGSSTDYLATKYGLGGPRATLSSACTSSAAAIVYAAALIREGVANAIVIGGCDRVRRADYAGFNALRAMSADYCRPFDLQRQGIIMGDGAAFLVLESEVHARSRGVRPLAELSGTGMSSDAHHATAPHPDGAADAINQALHMAQLHPKDIAYVNCHGTGTALNDKNEAEALAKVFGPELPNLYATSTKALTGHLLGTAGAIEALISVLVLNKGWIPPMPTVREVDPCAGFRLTRKSAVKINARHVMSNSLGFGGTNVSLIFSSINKEETSDG